ncbi:bis(5'-nucleosyl)-tetraphosphatase (symmetrical) YqeK [Peptococcus simiae]|uniref:bis(5'-nucleosyl)-tetraphosphatase (symmetrical) YqeK n=1 Tax=Peptococcus simiae TaxID=1643805 RepID=UPI00397FD27B
MKYEQFRTLLSQELGPKRLAHCQRVADTAAQLAEKYGADVDDAYLAGLMHDYAKKFDQSRLYELAKEGQLITDPCEEKVPDLLHGVVGAYLLEESGRITNKAVLQAMASHTVGRANMSLLDKIVYLADYIEPGRTTPGLEAVRQATEKNLDEGLFLALSNTLSWLLSEKKVIHPNSILMYNWLITEVLN